MPTFCPAWALTYIKSTSQSIGHTVWILQGRKQGTMGPGPTPNSFRTGKISTEWEVLFQIKRKIIPTPYKVHIGTLKVTARGAGLQSSDTRSLPSLLFPGERKSRTVRATLVQLFYPFLNACNKPPCPRKVKTFLLDNPLQGRVLSRRNFFSPNVHACLLMIMMCLKWSPLQGNTGGEECVPRWGQRLPLPRAIASVSLTHTLSQLAFYKYFYNNPEQFPLLKTIKSPWRDVLTNLNIGKSFWRNNFMAQWLLRRQWWAAANAVWHFYFPRLKPSILLCPAHTTLWIFIWHSVFPYWQYALKQKDYLMPLHPHSYPLLWRLSRN